MCDLVPKSIYPISDEAKELIGAFATAIARQQKSCIEEEPNRSIQPLKPDIVSHGGKPLEAG